MLFPVIAVVLAVVTALVLLVAVVSVVKNRAANRAPAGSEPLPPTTLQRLSMWGGAASVVIIGAAAWLLTANGVETVMADDRLRLQFTAIVMAGVVVFAMLAGVAPWALIRRMKLDERDLAVVKRAPILQGTFTLLTMAVWTFGLQETFRGTPGVPMAYIHLMFWSCLGAQMLAWPVGVLLGYLRD